MRLLRLVQRGGPTTLGAQRVMAFPPEDIIPTWLPYHGARWVRFTAGGQQAVVVTFDATIHVIDLSQWQEQEFSVMGTFDGGKPAGGQEVEVDFSDETPQTTSLLRMELSPDGHYLATHNDLGETQVFNLQSMTRVAQLPRFPAPCSVMFFHPTCPLLVVVLASYHVYVYDYEKQRFTEWSNEVSKTPLSMIAKIQNPFIGGAFIKNPSSRFYLWTLNQLVLFDMDKGSSSNPRAGKKTGVQGYVHDKDLQLSADYLKEHPDFAKSTLPQSVCPVRTLRGIVSVRPLPSGGLYSVEFPETVLLKQLPPAYYRKKFT
ncbi:U3 small nucleolar RNA-associated protein [Dispira parvispora]|uniref:U3 small nucleolar RNA-associated protein n=1 Tax=Dispira parvispora TaxID=1520584 RepID=A0A9W8E355_9FUNG|nr:U3 small nucleolar RNA-associated protein [Dispira parvispora]